MKSSQAKMAGVQAGRIVFDLLQGHYRMSVSFETAQHE
jgi:hypothetical protein